MQYALGNFTKFVKGSKPHLASVCFRIDFIDSTRNRCCLFASIALKDPAWTPNNVISGSCEELLLLQLISIYYVLPSIGIRLIGCLWLGYSLHLNYAPFCGNLPWRNSRHSDRSV